MQLNQRAVSISPLSMILIRPHVFTLFLFWLMKRLTTKSNQFPLKNFRHMTTQNTKINPKQKLRIHVNQKFYAQILVLPVMVQTNGNNNT